MVGCKGQECCWYSSLCTLCRDQGFQSSFSDIILILFKDKINFSVIQKEVILLGDWVFIGKHKGIIK